jgi:drug/metabolite transporter (DMT)-like permease
MRDDGDAETGPGLGCAADPDDAPPPPRPWWCFPLLAAAVLAVSSAGAVFQKMPDVPPITLAAWRLQLTTLILVAGAVPQWRGMPAADRRRALSRPDALWTAFSGTCLAAHFGAWVASLKATSLPHSLLLVSMAPVLLVCLALARREPISAGEVGGTLLALAGGAQARREGGAQRLCARCAVFPLLQVAAFFVAQVWNSQVLQPPQGPRRRLRPQAQEPSCWLRAPRRGARERR